MQVLDVMEARARTFERLFVLGLERGAFPRPRARGSAVRRRPAAGARGALARHPDQVPRPRRGALPLRRAPLRECARHALLAGGRRRRSRARRLAVARRPARRRGRGARRPGARRARPRRRRDRARRTRPRWPGASSSASRDTASGWRRRSRSRARRAARHGARPACAPACSRPWRTPRPALAPGAVARIPGRAGRRRACAPTCARSRSSSRASRPSRAVPGRWCCASSCTSSRWPRTSRSCPRPARSRSATWSTASWSASCRPPACPRAARSTRSLRARGWRVEWPAPQAFDELLHAAAREGARARAAAPRRPRPARGRVRARDPRAGARFPCLGVDALPRRARAGRRGAPGERASTAAARP